MPSVSATIERYQSFGMGQASAQHPARISPVELLCPACRIGSFALTYASMAHEQEAKRCRDCSAELSQENGIWKALRPDRQKYFLRFANEYEFVRQAEGRGSHEAGFYLALPDRDLTRRNSWQWSIRAKTYHYLEQRILPGLCRQVSRPLTILDLGAGNCWLSYRLAKMGHRPIALDLLTNSVDGLNAAIHYREALRDLFPRIQAELDELPFADGQFDCAIFGASLHYSENYERTLGEAIRCLRPGGTVIIVDSPFYESESSGQRMKEERHELFLRRFGFRSDGLNSIEYLTKNRLISLEAQHDIAWEIHRVWYGIRWACRPLVAKWRRRREPSKFWILTAKVKSHDRTV